jgi:hypothetical protein
VLGFAPQDAAAGGDPQPPTLTEGVFVSPPRSGAPVAGVLLIAFGLVFLASQMHWIPNAGEFIGHWWPAILILIGLTQVLTGNRSGGSFAVLAIGVIFLAVQLGMVSHHVLWRMWPVLLIIVGLAMVVGALAGRVRGGSR